MRDVDKATFFSVIGPMNVTPRVHEARLKERFHTSEWETPLRKVVGQSVSDSWAIIPTQYFLC